MGTPACLRGTPAAPQRACRPPPAALQHVSRAPQRHPSVFAGHPICSPGSLQGTPAAPQHACRAPQRHPNVLAGQPRSYPLYQDGDLDVRSRTVLRRRLVLALVGLLLGHEVHFLASSNSFTEGLAMPTQYTVTRKNVSVSLPALLERNRFLGLLRGRTDLNSVAH